jgi:hypothetical protein
MPRRERVPVRWGFVLLVGALVFGVIGAAVWFGGASVAEDPKVKKDAISLVRRALGH